MSFLGAMIASIFDYSTLKILHLFGVIIFLGNIIITGWWKLMADRTADGTNSVKKPKISWSRKRITFAWKKIRPTDAWLSLSESTHRLGFRRYRFTRLVHTPRPYTVSTPLYTVLFLLVSLTSVCSRSI